jgi:hypothetical protein
MSVCGKSQNVGAGSEATKCPRCGLGRDPVLALRNSYLRYMVTSDEPKIFASSTVAHPVDRTALHALEARVGEECALASCQVRDTLFAVVNTRETEPDRGTAVLRSSGDEWLEVDRCAFWTDALRVIGQLLDQVIDEVPVDPIDQPSPTLVMPLSDGGVEMMFRTDDGIRVARELDASCDPRFEVYDKLWITFTAATEDEASDQEIKG